MSETDQAILPYTIASTGVVQQPPTARRIFDWALSGAAQHRLSADLAGIFLVVVALFTFVAETCAEDKNTVQAGASVVIATSAKTIVNNSGLLRGTVSIIESTTNPKTYTIVYWAPKVTSDFTDAIKYSDGTSDHTVLVSVAASTEPPTLISNGIYEQSFKALFVLFIIATILESGLAVIFNWRPFIQLFDARGVKTIVSVLFAWFFVGVFGLDIVTRLVNVYSDTDYPARFPGTFITALVLAGGSSAVNNLLVALGFRSIKTVEQMAPKPPRTEAWISVRLIRIAAKGPVAVLIGPQGVALPVAGMITGSSSTNALLRFFLRDYGRFPTAGGYSVIPVTTQAYEVRLEGMEDSTSSAIISSPTWGPYPLAAGAIVDIELQL